MWCAAHVGAEASRSFGSSRRHPLPASSTAAKPTPLSQCLQLTVHTPPLFNLSFHPSHFFCLLCKGLPLSFSHCPNHLYLNHRQKSLSSQFPHHPSDYGEDVRGVAEPTCKALLSINGSCIAIILNVLIRNPKISREKSKQNQEEI